MLYWADSYDADGRVLIDPNKWSEDGTIALGQTAGERRRPAAGLRPAGGGVRLGRPSTSWKSSRAASCADELKWSRHGNIVWNAAGDGFFYARYPEPPEGEQYQALSLNQMIYFHKLGDAAGGRPARLPPTPSNPQWSFWLTRTDDDQYLVLSIGRSTDPQNKVLVRPRRRRGTTRRGRTLIDDFDNEFGFIGNDGSRLLFLTDLDATTKRDRRDGRRRAGPRARRGSRAGRRRRRWSAPACSTASSSASIWRTWRRASTCSRSTGKPLGNVELPGVGTAGGFGGEQTDTETFYTFTSYTTPPSIYRYDLDARRSRADPRAEDQVRSRRSTNRSSTSARARTARACRSSSPTARG